MFSTYYIKQMSSHANQLSIDSLLIQNDFRVAKDTIVADSTLMKVGIGKTLPLYTLDVDGDINLSGDIRIAGVPVTNITNVLPITLDVAQGRIGVANAAPAYPLDVTGDVNTTTKYKIGTVDTLTATTLGAAVVNSSLTSTGTLASLNVTGDLAVDTNTLKVDAATNRVGIVQVAPAYPLDVTGDINTTTKYRIGNIDTLNETTLGATVLASSLTSVGALTSLAVTGDLVVDTSTLKVDSNLNRVGIVKAAPAYPLDVVGDINTTTKYKIGTVDTLTDTTLGGLVLNSSLTSVGTLTSLSVAGMITPYTATAASPAAGQLGYTKTIVLAAPVVVPGTTAITNVTSLALGVGVWSIKGYAKLTDAAGAVMHELGIQRAINTLQLDDATGDNYVSRGFSYDATMAKSPLVQVQTVMSLTVAATVYLNSRGTQSGADNWLANFCGIRATRIA
jgi:hypothetical protein